VTAITWETVREIGLKLANTTAGTAWRSPTLEVNGRRFAGVPVHRSAEPDSFAIHCDFAERDALIDEQPDVYYTAAHYENYPCVLVRLSRVNRDALEDLLRMAHRFVSSQPQGRRSTRREARSPGDRTTAAKPAAASTRDFDITALYEAMDAQRIERGLSWRQVADQLWAQSSLLNRKRHDHPISPSTLTGIARRRDCTCQHALFILRWLGRSPESLIGRAERRFALPAAGPDRRLRWDLTSLYEALDTRRRERQLSWAQLAYLLRCTPHQLTGIRTARYAIGMRLAMRLVQWLEQPARVFIYAAEW
jgi:hypothetical protein